MTMSKVRRATAALALTGLALTTAACGGGAQPGGGGGGDGLSAWTLTGGAEPTFRESFEAWNSANPDEEISSQFFANDAYKEKIRTAIGSGNAPTLVFGWGGGALQDYVDNGAVVDLTGKTEELQSRLLPSVLETGMVDDKVYAVPNNNAQPVVLYYNKSVLGDAGVDGAPATFEELLDDVETMKQAGIETPIALAGASQWPELMWIEYLADRVGGPETFQDVVDGKPGAWSSPEMLEALGMVQELVDAGAFGDTFGSVVADANADAALVHTGRAGMLLQGAWVYSTFLTDAPDFVASGDLGFAGFPAVEGGAGDPKAIVGNPANFWSVSADASPEAQQAAVDYLNSAMYDEDYVQSLVASGNVPVTDGAESVLEGSDQAEFLTFAYDMVQEAPSFQLSWDQALSPAASQQLLTSLSQLFLGQVTPEEFAQAMEQA